MKTLKLVQNLAMVALVATMALSAFAVPATAQGGTGVPPASFTLKTATGTGSPQKVDIDQTELSIPWTYTFGNAATPLVGAVQTSTTLTWVAPVECNKPGVVVLGSFSELIPLGQGAATTGKVEQTSKFIVKVTEEAPGETTITCTMKAHMGAVGAIPQTSDSNVPFSVVAAYRGILSTSLENAIGEAGPQAPITYNIRVDNLGNSESNVNFNLVENKAAADSGWQPVIPSSFVLETAKKGGSATSRVVPFQIATPHKNGWNNQETTFQLKITPSSQKDTANVGQEYTVTMLARVRGIYVPGPEPLLVFAAVLGTALVSRRLRQ